MAVNPAMQKDGWISLNGFLRILKIWKITLMASAVFWGCIFQGGLNSAHGSNTPESRLAFPGAEGFGRYSLGGRGGRIVQVVNLNPSGPGSFKEAVSTVGPRVVVFRVSGIIDLKRPLVIREPFITIAGQTAPGDGICLRTAGLVVKTHDVVIRFLRIRAGDDPDGPNPESRDCLGIIAGSDSVYNVMVDHCSFSWGIDENVSTYGRVRNITIQWSIISESLLDSLHPKGLHGMGMILGRQDNTITVHHNLFAHNNGRNPLIYNEKKSGPPTMVDFQNNAIYNHGGRPIIQIRGPSDINYVGNTVKTGHNSKKGRVDYDEKAGQRFFVKDNFLIGHSNEVRKNDAFLDILPSRLTSKQTVFGESLASDPASKAYRDILSYAGAYLPKRDVVDARVIDDVHNGTGAIIDSPSDVGGWPGYETMLPPRDTDKDGMPDAWETKYRFAPRIPDDAWRDFDGDGYANIEEFLNGTDPKRVSGNEPIHEKMPVVGLQSGRLRQEKRPEKSADARRGLSMRSAFINDVKASGKDVAHYLGLHFVKISAGQFVKGWTGNKVTVMITRPYEISIFEVTQKQWAVVMGTTPWANQPYARSAAENAASYVSWDDCQEFISRLNATSLHQYRLPTEAEWDFAFIAGAKTDAVFPFDKRQIGTYAWYRDNTIDLNQKYAHPVGSKKPNAWGIFDMAGNVSEWCRDIYSYQYWRRGNMKVDPGQESRTGPSGALHPVRGGAFYYNASQIMKYYPYKAHRSTYRNFEVGFRLVKDVF